MLFALGMCMALLPEWNAFVPGIVFGCAGLALALVAVFVWRRMEHKAPLRPSRRAVLTAIVCTVGALALGVGMCLCMVWQNLALGIVVGLVGIVILLGLIPMVRGLR